jgi:hypothetical protein
MANGNALGAVAQELLVCLLVECVAVLRGHAPVDEEGGIHVQEVEVVGGSHNIWWQ